MSEMERPLVLRTRGSRAPASPLVKAAALAAVALTVAGCGSGFSGVYDLPLPGGADVGDHPYKVTAQFANVRDLVPQAAVKVNDVAVGRVAKITLPRGSWTANVTLLLNGKVRLPANAFAQLAQSSLLGEKYVQLSAPTDGSAQGTLVAGMTIPTSRTNRDPEIEEVFGAMSLLLNGGGLNQLKTITVELNKALGGNEPQIRSMLERVNTLVSSLNDHRTDITTALDGLDRLSANLAGRKGQIATVLNDLSPGMKVLDAQRGSLVTMLKALETLSGVATDTIDRSKDDMVASLRALAPILGNLSDAGQNLPRALQVLVTYPFTDQVLAGGVKGDYLNVYLSVTAVPGTTLIPLLDPNEKAPATRANLPKPAPLPLPAVGAITTTPTPGAATPPGSTPPGSTPPGSTAPGSTSPGSTAPGSSTPSGSGTPGTSSGTPSGSPSSTAGGN